MVSYVCGGVTRIIIRIIRLHKASRLKVNSLCISVGIDLLVLRLKRSIIAITDFPFRPARKVASRGETQDFPSQVLFRHVTMEDEKLYYTPIGSERQ